MSEPKKRWLHISLRDLFWLVLVCALVIGWWSDRSMLNAHCTKEINRLQAKSLVLEMERALLNAELQSKVLKLTNLTSAAQQLDKATPNKLEEAVHNAAQANDGAHEP